MADAMLAGYAKSLGLVTVTRNVKHFRRVRGLVVENWFRGMVASIMNPAISHSNSRFGVLRSLLAISLMLTAPAAATGQAEDSLPDVLRRTAPSVVQIRIGDFWGSGFLYPTAHHVVTSFSVVNQRGDLSVVLSDGSVHEARVVAWSEADDLALLELPTPARAQPLALSTLPPYAGQPVVLLGYPSKPNPSDEPPPRLDVPSPRFGRISTVYDRRLRVDADAWQGDSGAPLLAPSGEVGPARGKIDRSAVRSSRLRIDAIASA